MQSPFSELSWRLADFLEANVEPPASCIGSPNLTEGEMMTDEEIEEYIKDSMATCRILLDKRSDRFNDLVANYVADLSYLKGIGRISEDDYNDLTHPDNLRF